MKKLTRILASVIIPIAGCQTYTHSDMASNYNLGFDDGYAEGLKEGMGAENYKKIRDTPVMQSFLESARQRDLSRLNDKMNLNSTCRMLSDIYERQGDTEKADYFRAMAAQAKKEQGRIESNWALEGIIIELLKAKKQELKE